jgi:hypothetical protein
MKSNRKRPSGGLTSRPNAAVGPFIRVTIAAFLAGCSSASLSMLPVDDVDNRKFYAAII